MNCLLKEVESVSDGGERIIERIVEKEKPLGPQQLDKIRMEMEASMKRELLEQGGVLDDEHLSQVIFESASISTSFSDQIS